MEASDEKLQVEGVKSDIFKVPVIPSKTEDSANSLKNDTVPCSEKIPYTPPDWASTPPENEDGCYIEVIKNGTIVDVIQLRNLKNESFLSVGRFAPCEIQLDHPSVSRYHCVLQFGKIANRNCWSIYDLGSTHGTKLNKQIVKKRSYIKLRPGYVIQFAGSTRIFSFCGNEESEEAEQLSKDEPQDSVKEAMESDCNDPKYYEKDPLGYLDKYFEREGTPMNFQYAKAEKGASEWSCSIELPDFPENEALVSGTGITRKLAQFQCALLACQRLEAAGLLNTSSIWNKRATYVENDYYDSDEDIYLDRTGQIEVQRAKRRKRCEGDAAGISDSPSLTHDELVKSLAETEKKLEDVNAEIQRLIGKNCYTDGEGKLVSTSTNFSTRMIISQMRSKEKRFREECEQLEKLVLLTKPRGLDKFFPAQKPLSGQAVSSPKEGPSETNLNDLDVSEGHETNDDVEMPNATTSNENIAENKEIEAKVEPKKGSTSDKSADKANVEIVDDIEHRVEIKPKRPERVYQPAAPPPDSVETKGVILPKYGLITKEEARIKNPTLAKQQRQKQALNDELAEEKPSGNLDGKYSGKDYTTWLPPQDQIGDGVTKLNKKFEGRY